MALELHKLPKHTVETVVEFLVANRRCRNRDQALNEILSMTSQDFLDAWLCWNGIIGWTEAIVQTLDKAREAEYH